MPLLGVTLAALWQLWKNAAEPLWGTLAPGFKSGFNPGFVLELSRTNMSKHVLNNNKNLGLSTLEFAATGFNTGVHIASFTLGPPFPTSASFP